MDLLKRIYYGKIIGLFRDVIAFVALSGAFVLSGCGTVGARMSEISMGPDPSDHFSSVEFDYQMLSFQQAYLSMVCYVTIVCPIVVVVSMPVDAVIDVALLPFEL